MPGTQTSWREGKKVEEIKREIKETGHGGKRIIQELKLIKEKCIIMDS